jgi:hypothetical protein
MRLTGITNMFNMVTRIHPEFMNYHFGWASDMARNIQNNYDPEQTTGTLYPAVLVVPQEMEYISNQRKMRYLFRVHFIELQGYLNTTEARIHTKVEQWSDLIVNGTRWFEELKRANNSLTKPVYLALKSGDVRGFLDESATQRRLIYVAFDFEVLAAADCEDLGLTYPDDITAVGYDWPPTENYDLENIYNYSGDLIDDGIMLPPNAIGTGFFEQAFVSQTTDTMTVTVNDLPNDPAQIWVYYDNGQVLSRNYWSKSGNNITLTFTPPVAQTIWIKFYA